VLPETTWFIKNLYHSNFPASVDALMNAFLVTDGMTIDTYEEYSQFLKYDEETGAVSKVVGLDEGDIIDKDSVEAKTSLFMKVLKLILEFFTKLLNGDFSFSFGKDE